MQNEEFDVKPLRLISIILLISSFLLLASNSRLNLSSHTFSISLVIMAIILELEISRRLRGYLAVPLAALVATLYLCIGISGFQNNANLSISRLSGFRVKLPPVESIETLKIYIFAAIAILFGYGLRSELRANNFKPNTVDQGSLLSQFKLTKKFKLQYIVYIISFSNIAYILLYGVSDLIFRSEYIPIQSNIVNNFLLSLVNIVNLIGFFALGWVSTKLHGFQNLTAWSAFTFSLLVYFGDGSRAVGLGVLLFFAGRIIDKRKVLRIIIFIFSVPISVLLSNLIVFFRSGSKHGLVGHISQLNQFDFSNIANFFQSNLASSSFAITGFSGVIANKIPFNYFFIEINPLPGGLTGWYEIASTMRFNYYTPYTSIGALYNYSPLLLLLFFVLLGVFTSNLVLFQPSDIYSINNLRYQVNVGSVLLFSLLSIQYNLRSSLRILYLAFIINIYFIFRERRLARMVGKYNGY
jgi:hypothetical protein